MRVQPGDIRLAAFPFLGFGYDDLQGIKVIKNGKTIFKFLCNVNGILGRVQKELLSALIASQRQA